MADPKSWLDFFTIDMRPEDRRAVIRFVWRALLAAHIALACGWLAWAGFPGFAWASDMKRVSLEVSSIKADFVEWQIWDARVRQCEAVKAGEPRTAYSQRLSALLTKYQQLTGQTFPLLSCAEQ